MEIIGEYIDRLITIEMRPHNFIRGKIGQLYNCAREKLGVTSLTLLAAQKTIENVQEKDNIFIVTGCASTPYLPHGETDGPLGAASIARAVSLGLGVNPLLICGERDIDPTRCSVRAAGLNVEEYQTGNNAVAVPFPYYDEENAKEAAVELIDKYNPKAVFSFEVLGPNSKGIHHSVMGIDLTSKLPKLYHIFDEANRREILTIAGIDGGNELGSGNIEEEVRRIMPYGDVCQCPCKSGNACCVKADVTIPAATSNWAAYGISAMLAFLIKKPNLLQDADTEQRMLEACVMAGAADGLSFRPVTMVDGISHRANQSLINLLHEIIGNGLSEEKLGRQI